MASTCKCLQPAENIARKKGRARGSEADLAQCGALALPPPFLFLWLLVQFFFSTPPCLPKRLVSTIISKAISFFAKCTCTRFVNILLAVWSGQCPPLARPGHVCLPASPVGRLFHDVFYFWRRAIVLFVPSRTRLNSSSSALTSALSWEAVLCSWLSHRSTLLTARVAWSAVETAENASYTASRRWVCLKKKLSDRHHERAGWPD